MHLFGTFPDSVEHFHSMALAEENKRWRERASKLMGKQEVDPLLHRQVQEELQNVKVRTLEH